MTDPTAISSIGDLTKPATVLVEKISEAVGGIFRPMQIVRVAKAEAAAALLRAETDVQITELQRRGMHRLLEEEGKKQANMENVTLLALPQVDPASDPSQVDNDWIANFFDKCRLTSDEEMQALWSRVLAGEANAPGTFSRRTVNFLASLDKNDAEQFTALCCFAWSFAGLRDLVPLVFDPSIDIYTSHKVRFANLNHLESIGLIHFERVAGFRKIGLRKQTTLSYFGNEIGLELPNESDNHLDIGHVQLTRTGAELAPICGAEPNEAFFAYVVQKWQREGYLPSDGDAATAG